MGVLVEQFFEEAFPLLIRLVTRLSVLRLGILRLGVLRLGLLRLRPRPSGLRINEAFQLAAVEKDPSAVTALVNMHATSLVLTHRAMALGAGHFHISTIHRERAFGNLRPWFCPFAKPKRAGVVPMCND